MDRHAPHTILSFYAAHTPHTYKQAYSFIQSLSGGKCLRKRKRDVRYMKEISVQITAV